MEKGKQSKGRKKIELKPIENEQARQVCFSKRRQGLFKKASELSVLCGAMVGTIVFSTVGRSFSFGHPSIDEVMNRFLNPDSPNDPALGGPSHDRGESVTDKIHELSTECSELEQLLESEKKKKERLQEATEKEMGERMMQWLNANILDLSLDELLEFQKKLEEVHEIVKEKIDSLLVGGRQTLSLPQAPMERASTSQSANPMVPLAPSSSIAFINGIEVNDPLLGGGVDGVGGLGNFPNNQNHG